jgi:hypothetical protein
VHAGGRSVAQPDAARGARGRRARGGVRHLNCWAK